MDALQTDVLSYYAAVSMCLKKFLKGRCLPAKYGCQTACIDGKETAIGMLKQSFFLFLLRLQQPEGLVKVNILGPWK